MDDLSRSGGRGGTYDFSDLNTAANLFAFPNLESGTICYTRLQGLDGAEAVQPALSGLDRLVNVVQQGDAVTDGPPWKRRGRPHLGNQVAAGARSKLFTT